MLQDILSTFGGAEHYGVASLCLFGLVFIGVIIWTMLRKRSYLDRMASAPLDPDSVIKEEGTNCHE